MPWSGKQHRLFEAVAHGAKPHKGNLSEEEAAKLASEGVKPEEKKRKKQRATVRNYRG